MRSFTKIVAVGAMAFLALLLIGCQSGGLVFGERFAPEFRGADETVLAFGSCLRTTRPAPLLDEIAATNPDALILLGDNVYVTGHRRVASAEGFDEAYARLAKLPSWQRLRNATPRLLATWDDHDYGRNDAGASWRLKDDAKRSFLRFFELPADSPVRERGGIYHAVSWGDSGRRVQVILLDTRWFRDRLRARITGLVGRGGPYLPTNDTSRTLLGEPQWAWLADKLREPADVRVIASSIQVLAGHHGWEAWANFPHERQRLFDLIAETNAQGVVLISGDRHFGEMSYIEDDALAYPLWDVTSSGLNEKAKTLRERNPLRIGPARRAANFGLVRIDWSGEEPRVTFELRAEGGEVFNRQSTSRANLKSR